jgi:transcriptional regulator GlxA family with amidase domain
MTLWVLLAEHDCGDLLIVTNHWRLRRLLNHLEANFEHSLSLAAAAEICGLERTYFCRFFQAQTGITFSEWYRQVRVKRAKSLLQREHRSISEIAVAAGYKDITTFERHFRRGEKLSPAQYRKLRRAGGIDGETQQLPIDTYTTAAERIVRQSS